MSLAAVIPDNSPYVGVFPGGTKRSGTGADFSPKAVNPLKVKSKKPSAQPQKALNVGTFQPARTLPLRFQVKSQPFVIGRSGVRKRHFKQRRR